MTHVRAAIGSPIQETNCHPFRRGNWLFVHNGFIADFHLLRRDLMLAIDPELFADVQGSTDTEVVFHLALTLGLEANPIGALERTVGLIEETGRRQGVTNAVQASFGVSDGESLWRQFATPAAVTLARCSPRRTRTRSGTSIPTTRASSASPRTTG
jgi:predicted glutamine amidotransferase